MKPFFALTLSLSLAVGATASLAGGDAATPAPSSKSSAQLSAEATQSVVAEISGGEASCLNLETVYQFDCFRQNYRSAAKAAGKQRAYRDAAAALKDVENTLNAVVRQNRDKSKPTIRVGGKTYKAIKPETVQASAKTFQAARAQAATKLLRSGGEAQVHYAKIAQAMNSNKVLIRS